MASNPAFKYTWTPHSEQPERLCVLTITFPGGSTKSQEIDLPAGAFGYCFDLWERGLLIQDAFPMLTEDECEFILTGLTPDEWDDIMRDIEDEE